MKKTCELAPLYFYGELEQQQAKQFRAHLQECAVCQREIAFLHQIQAALLPPAAPVGLVEKVLQQRKALPFWQRIYKPVLATVLIVGLGVWAFMGQEHVQNTADTGENWLAYVSEDIDADYDNFLADFEVFEAEF